MTSVLTSYQREQLKKRKRKRIKVRGRKGFTYNGAATRPGDLAKANTCTQFAEKIQRQLERYGMTDADEKMLLRVVAMLNGTVQNHRAEKTLPFPGVKRRTG